MAQPKPLASLSPSLLARKGAARPAMRPQSYTLGGTAAAAPLDDLGWNDMGQSGPAACDAASPDIGDGGIPAVLVERETLAQLIETPAAVRSVSVATATRLQRETGHAGKAALTLRLDAERHLRLRLASAITNRSAQDLLTQALDALIDALPTVATLVAQLPPPKQPKR